MSKDPDAGKILEAPYGDEMKRDCRHLIIIIRSATAPSTLFGLITYLIVLNAYLQFLRAVVMMIVPSAFLTTTLNL